MDHLEQPAFRKELFTLEHRLKIYAWTNIKENTRQSFVLKIRTIYFIVTNIPHENK